MAANELLYRIEFPDLWIPESPFWRAAPHRISRLYMPVTQTSVWLTEFESETRVVFRQDAAGPWSVVYVGVFNLASYVSEIDRVQEMA